MEQLIFTALFFILGTAIGSFINVLVERTARGESIKGRSYCESCKKQLTPKDLFPIFSYIRHRGRCAYCHDKLSSQYLIIETITGILFAAMYLLVSHNFILGSDYAFNLLHIPSPYNIATLLYYSVTISALIALFISDYKYGMLYDKITIPTILFVVMYKTITMAVLFWQSYGGLNSSEFGRYLIEAGFLESRINLIASPFIYTIAGSLGIALFFLLLIIITKGRGMGGGDVKLGFLVGLLSGWPYMLMTVLISFLTGSLYSIILLSVRKKKMGQTIPFGPFLIIATVLVMFFGDQLFNWYLVGILGLEPLR